MKIFYAVQATGNGHISRAMELLPYLQQYGTVDIFLSGDNSHLPMDAPVKYRSKGLSLYYNATGGLDYWKIMKNFNPLALRKQISELPVEKYDLVINDFEFITGAACAKKKIASVQLGHQASFRSPRVPKPRRKDHLGEWVLMNYAKASHHIGLHFKEYDDFIYPPVIKKDILQAEPKNKGHVTVYLPSIADTVLEKWLSPIKDQCFQIFSAEAGSVQRKGQFIFYPVNKKSFNESMITCAGIICGAGFETPSEALFLGKKMICIPTRGHYEQLCNAAALENLGIKTVKTIGPNTTDDFYKWIESTAPPPVRYGNIIPAILDRLFTCHATMKKPLMDEMVAPLPSIEFA